MNNTIKFDKKSTLAVAHRGVSGVETENTCAAFVAAGQRTYFGIETDVHVTSDGKFAIIHDDNILRVSGVDMPVEGSSLADLRTVTLYARDTKDTRCDLVIPELIDYSRICRKYNKISVLELKNRIADEKIAEIIDIVRSADQLENTIFISFSLENCKTVRRLLPEQKIQFLTSKWTDELIQTLVSEKLDLDIYHECLDKARVDALHAAGIVINCWTCDDPKRGEELAEMGVDQITSNILE